MVSRSKEWLKLRQNLSKYKGVAQISGRTQQRPSPFFDNIFSIDNDALT
jgi:hypothetical protein